MYIASSMYWIFNNAAIYEVMRDSVTQFINNYYSILQLKYVFCIIILLFTFVFVIFIGNYRGILNFYFYFLDFLFLLLALSNFYKLYHMTNCISNSILYIVYLTFHISFVLRQYFIIAINIDRARC